MGDSLDDIRAALRRRDEASPPPAPDVEDGRAARLVTATRALARRGISDVRTAASSMAVALRSGRPAFERVASAIAHAATLVGPGARAIARGARAMVRTATTLLVWSLDMATRAWVAARNAARSRPRSAGPRVVRSRPASLAPTASPDPQPGPTATATGRSWELQQAEHRLAAAERAFGYDHPSVAAELQLIGALHHQAAMYDEALAFYGAALGIQERTLGPGHAAAVETAIDAATARQEELAARDTAGV